MADDARLNAAEPLGVDVEQLARPLALVAHDGRPRLERRQAPQPQPAQHIADRREGEAQPVGDPRPREAPPAQRPDAPLERGPELAGRVMGPGRAIPQRVAAPGAVAGHPLPHGARTHPEGGRRLRPGPAGVDDALDEADSPREAEPCILVAVH